MSIFTERIQRDDMYALSRNGSKVDKGLIEGKRLEILDLPHVFLDGTGEILPSGSLRAKNDRRIGLFKSRTFKLGPPHSHDSNHTYHVLEKVSSEPTTIIKKFRRHVKDFRERRKESRDR